jgi:polyphosphate kinase 2 (PPK2 family)
VHPSYVVEQNILRIESEADLTPEFWTDRYASIRNWENHLAKNSAVILKFFLNVGQDEQKARFLSRIDVKKKNWKFNFNDMKERALWPKYMQAYQDAIQNTARKDAPWYVIPADSKPIMIEMVAKIVTENFKNLNLKYPTVGQKEIAKMAEPKKFLENA